MRLKKITLIVLALLPLASCISAPQSRKHDIPESSNRIIIADDIEMRLVSLQTELDNYKDYTALAGSKLTVITVVLDKRVDPTVLGTALINTKLFSYDKERIQIGDSILCMVDSNKFYTSREMIKNGVSHTPGKEINLVFINFTDSAVPISMKTRFDEKHLFSPGSEEYINSEKVIASIKNIEEFFRYSATGDIENLTRMLERDPDLVNAKINNKASALFIASLYGRKEAISLLLSYKADPYYSWALQDSSAIIANCFTVSVYKGYKDIVELYVESGIDINRAEEPGWSALLIAAYMDNVELVEYLVGKGASLDQKITYKWSGTKKGIVELIGERKSTRVLEYLMEKGYIE